jgi:hypothetical protein
MLFDGAYLRHVDTVCKAIKREHRHAAFSLIEGDTTAVSIEKDSTALNNERGEEISKMPSIRRQKQVRVRFKLLYDLAWCILLLS